MLKYIITIIVLNNFVFAYASTLSTNSNENSMTIPHKFEKVIESKKMRVYCENIKDCGVGMFTIIYKENDIINEFSILKGLDFETCNWHVKKVNDLRRKFSKLKLSGRNGTKGIRENEILWNWESVTAAKKCHGYLSHDCP